MKKIITNKYMPYILISLLTLVICIPMFTMNLYELNEERIHMSRIISIDEVIKSGVFPPIIDYKFMNGFGYALNLFYGPITTYIPIIIYNIFKTAGMAIKIFTVITVFLSGIFMYKFVYSITKRKSISIISALIYMSTPYKLSNIYSRNAVGEYTAFIFIPIVFQSLHNLINGDKKKHYLLSIGVIGLVLSHTITTLYTAIFCFLYLILNIKKLKDIDIWKKIVINIFIAFLVCSFYAIPLLEHAMGADYVMFSQDRMRTSGEHVWSQTIGLKDLFANECGNQEIRFSIGLPTCIFILLTFASYKKVKKEDDNIYSDFIILAIISLFLCTKLFPWPIMPSFMTVIQFAWRNLGFFAFFISFVCGMNIIIFAENIIKKELWKETFIFGSILSIFVFAFLGVLRDYKFEDITKEKEIDINITKSEKIGPYNINRDYMPLKAINNIEYLQEREDRTYILEGEANIISEEKYRLNDKINIENVKEDTILELPYLYYLGYEVKISYDNINYTKLDTFESNNGFLAVKINKCDNASITIEYKGTTLEIASYIISIAGLILLIIYIIIEKKKLNKEK